MSSGILLIAACLALAPLIVTVKRFLANTQWQSSVLSTTSSTEPLRGALSELPERVAGKGEVELVDESELEPQQEYSKIMGISINQSGGRWRVVIDGTVYKGTGNPVIGVIDGVLHLDGVPHDQVKPLQADGILRLEVQILGNLPGALETDGDVTVHGDVQGSVSTQGNVSVTKSVSGRITTQGRVEVGGDVGGSIDTQGRVEVGGTVSQRVNTMGRVDVQGSVGGSINTMGKVNVYNR